MAPKDPTIGPYCKVQREFDFTAQLQTRLNAKQRELLSLLYSVVALAGWAVRSLPSLPSEFGGASRCAAAGRWSAAGDVSPIRSVSRVAQELVDIPVVEKTKPKLYSRVASRLYRSQTDTRF